MSTPVKSAMNVSLFTCMLLFQTMFARGVYFHCIQVSHIKTTPEKKLRTGDPIKGQDVDMSTSLQ